MQLIKYFDNKLNLNTLRILFIFIYFIFNFIHREISNIFLLLALIISLIDYKSLGEYFKQHSYLILSIIFFSLWITYIKIYHNDPISEFDNYYRFLLLIPLMIISLKNNQLILLVYLCAFASIIHLGLSYSFVLEKAFVTGNYKYIGRYVGTSSSSITYANMCALFFIMSMYLYFIKKNKSIFLILSSLVFLLILILTQTRGPLIGIILCLTYLIFLSRNRLLIILISMITISIIIIPNPLIDRIKILSQINILNDYEIISKSNSIKERVFYLQYGAEKLKNHPVIGIGPLHLEKDMINYKKERNIDIQVRDHLHNEFLDISVKLGLPALILLLLIYFALYKSSHKDNRVIINLILIMLVSSQLTQSQFAHHQAITFFIILLFLHLQPNHERV